MVVTSTRQQEALRRGTTRVGRSQGVEAAVGSVDLGGASGGGDDDEPAVAVDEGVMEPAEQGAVVEAGVAALGPGPAVVDVAPGGWPITAGEHTAAVAGRDGPA